MIFWISYDHRRSPNPLYQQTPYPASEEDMKSIVWTKPTGDRRSFIGGSDARIIMGNDEVSLSAPLARKAR